MIIPVGICAYTRIFVDLIIDYFTIIINWKLQNFGKIQVNKAGDMTVNQKIHIVRKEKKITAAVPAEKLGISQSTVVRYENGSVK